MASWLEYLGWYTLHADCNLMPCMVILILVGTRELVIGMREVERLNRDTKAIAFLVGA